jgi:probable phosphoglycerate mutase
MTAGTLQGRMATVLLVRHGETAWNRERRVQGWAPTSLTDRGREQAAAVAGHLAERGVDRVVASDLRRAAETARVVVRATGAPLALDRGWRERSVGVYQGLSPEELYGRHPEFSVFESGYAAAEATPEGGESIVDARDRVLDAFDRLTASLDGPETVAVVAHGGPVRMVAAHLREMDVVTALEDLAVENCSVTEVAVDDAPALASVGEVVSAVAAVDD